MDTTRISENTIHLNELKADARRTQKSGLPFMMASVLIWTMIMLIQFADIKIGGKNMLTFCCSCTLMPLAYIFSKIIKADIFGQLHNPVNKLGFLCTMNQMLYLVIVMWAFNQKPEAMMMLFAMVFGGHLLPYSWVYNAKPYIFASIIETIGVMIIALVFGNVPAAGFMIIMQLILCILLFRDLRKDS